MRLWRLCDRRSCALRRREPTDSAKRVLLGRQNVGDELLFWIRFGEAVALLGVSVEKGSYPPGVQPPHGTYLPRSRRTEEREADDGGLIAE
jgi:hypothetical protein